jgi:hypothetical protein
MVTMADSDALRQMRRRRHKQGDHHLCRDGCQNPQGSLRIVPVPPGSAENFDPASALRDLAAQLEQAYRADPANALLAKELRQTLLVLLPAREAGVDAELRQLMTDLGRPDPGPPREW